MLKSISPNPVFYGVSGFLLVVFVLLIGFAIADQLSTTGFDPHGHCFFWQPELLWSFVISDAFIGLSYMAISTTLGYFVTRARRDIPFNWMIIAFGTFIFACGLTHFMDIWTLWEPEYYLSVSVRIVTAVASLTTAVTLPFLVPRALRLIEAARISNQRKLQLEQMNLELQREISERKLYEQLLREANEKLEQRVNERTAELSAANEELQNFAYISSHDLQEPLRKIQLFSTRLQSQSDGSSENHTYLKRIEAAANRAQMLIDNVLLYTKVTRGVQNFTPVNLNDTLKTVLDTLDEQIEQTGGQVETNPLPVVYADAVQMEHLLQNLIENALKYHRPDVPPLVRVYAETTDKNYIIHIEDKGIGFEEKYSRKIFDFFERLDETRAGTGIGLAICRKIVERHHGTIEAKGSPNEGAKFTITLPKKETE